jgi:hypothetical protein
MTNLKDILKDLPKNNDSDDDSENLMNDPDYIRQSSKFISDSLRKGADVLQLDNGDIITTETKTITTQFSWDSKSKKMVKQKKPRKSTNK